MIVERAIRPIMYQRSPLTFISELLFSAVRISRVNKIFTHWTEYINQHSCFKTNSPVHYVGGNVKCISRSKYFLFSIYFYFKDPVLHMCDLRVMMLVQCSHSPFFKFYFYY